MQARPVVLIASEDAVLRELLGSLLRGEGFEVLEAADPAQAERACAEGRPSVILLDAVEDATLARAVLGDPFAALGAAQPALVLLSGSATAPDLVAHAYLDRVLSLPVQTEVLVETLRYHASGRARREMRSGVQLRATVAQTFATKRRTRTA